MTTFTINDENNIVAYTDAAAAARAGDSTATSFDSQAALAQVAANWPMSRFVEIWNGIPGQRPVSKFADRRKAVARIWKALQPLAENGAAAATSLETGNGKRAKDAVQKQSPRKAARAKKTGQASQRSNKKAEVIALMKRAKGATLVEIMHATGWQKHTVRGFVSLLGSKGGQAVESSKNVEGERTYKISR